VGRFYSPNCREEFFSETPIQYARIGIRYRSVGKRACSPGFLEEFFSETRAAPVRYPCIGPAINGISLEAEKSCLSVRLLYANVNEGFI
jgi:hypothetical protein